MVLGRRGWNFKQSREGVGFGVQVLRLRAGLKATKGNVWSLGCRVKRLLCLDTAFDGRLCRGYGGVWGSYTIWLPSFSLRRGQGCTRL